MNDDGIPAQYCYPCFALRLVWQELYTVMFKLVAELHMSKRQMEGSIIAIENLILGRSWKPHDKYSNPDLNTPMFEP